MRASRSLRSHYGHFDHSSRSNSLMNPKPSPATHPARQHTLITHNPPLSPTPTTDRPLLTSSLSSPPSPRLRLRSLPSLTLIHHGRQSLHSESKPKFTSRYCHQKKPPLLPSPYGFDDGFRSSRDGTAYEVLREMEHCVRRYERR